MPSVNDILRLKGQALFTISENDSVIDAVQSMNERKVGALLVARNGDYTGIFTERDVLTRVVAQQRNPKATRVGEVMTRDLVFCDLFTDLDDVAHLMKTRRIRHIPVRDGQGEVVGMVSIGDLNAFHVSYKQATIENLSDYICGRS